MISRKRLDSKEIKGEYSILWSGDETSVTGEKLRLRNRGKFEYGVFSGMFNEGWNDSEATLATGKFILRLDTLVITKVKGERLRKGEIFSFTGSYIVRIVEFTRQTKPGEPIPRFVCLIPVDKVDVFDEVASKLAKETAGIDTGDLTYRQMLSFDNDIKRVFWEKRIFVQRR